jgi:hypothetical protein
MASFVQMWKGCWSVWGFLGSFWTESVWPVCLTGLTGFPCLCEAKSNRSGPTGFRNRPDRFVLPAALSCVFPLRVCWGCCLGIVPRFSSTPVATWTWQEKLAEVHEWIWVHRPNSWIEFLSAPIHSPPLWFAVSVLHLRHPSVTLPLHRRVRHLALLRPQVRCWCRSPSSPNPTLLPFVLHRRAVIAPSVLRCESCRPLPPSLHCGVTSAPSSFVGTPRRPLISPLESYDFPVCPPLASRIILSSLHCWATPAPIPPPPTRHNAHPSPIGESHRPILPLSWSVPPLFFLHRQDMGGAKVPPSVWSGVEEEDGRTSLSKASTWTSKHKSIFICPFDSI